MKNQNRDLSGVTQIDWARLAAFIDGEGHVRVVSKKQKVKGRVYQQEYVEFSISNTSPLLMLWLTHNFGGSIQSAGLGKAHHKKRWSWYAASAHAVRLLTMARPYFVIKTEQVDLALSFAATMRRWGVKGTPQAVRDKRADLKSKLHVLTARGIAVGE